MLPMNPRPNDPDQLRAELENYKKLLIAAQKEAKEYKELYNESQKSIEFYEYQYKSKQKTVSRLISLLVLVGFLVIASFFFIITNKPPANDLQIKPTVTTNPSTVQSIVKHLKPVSTSVFSSSSSAKPESKQIYVWIPNSGKRYHDSERCSGMNSPKYVTLSEAKRRGYTPCGTCDPPR